MRDLIRENFVFKFLDKSDMNARKTIFESIIDTSNQLNKKETNLKAFQIAKK